MAASQSQAQVAHDGEATTRSKRPKKRIRPSRARGFRVNTGCVTCRNRRVKCDESRPRCGQCEKSKRGCQYAEPRSPQRQPRRQKAPDPSNGAATDTITPFDDQKTVDAVAPEGTTAVADTGIEGGEMGLEAEASTVSCNFSPIPAVGSFGTFQCSLSDQTSLESQARQHQVQPSVLQNTAEGDDFFMLDDADLGVAPDLSLSVSSYEKSPMVCGTVSDWTLLAEQDSMDMAARKVLSTDNATGFQSGVRSSHDDLSRSYHSSEAPTTSSSAEDPTPWNINYRITATIGEAAYIQYYTDVVGPMLDIMDISRQFSHIVPHLAMYDIGLFKAMIALAGRHMTVHDQRPTNDDARNEGDRPLTSTQVIASQYYSEAISYVCKTLCDESYSKTPEAAATTILISAYEMLDENESGGTANWERHLRGGFWIQRTQDNNAETESPLQRASWCAWVRQDIWAAFREGRRTLTLFHSRKALEDLDQEQLTARIILIAARCVDFAAESSRTCEQDVHACMRRGEDLLAELQRWHELLPRSFHPLAVDSAPQYDQSVFPTVWIHPPAHAAAVQMFHFARIIVSLHQPCVGGPSVYLKQQRRLEDSVRIICGIAATRQGEELPSACLNSQALFVAGLCVQTWERRDAVLTLLQKTHNASRLSSGLIEDLQRYWKGDP